MNTKRGKEREFCICILQQASRCQVAVGEIQSGTLLTTPELQEGSAGVGRECW